MLCQRREAVEALARVGRDVGAGGQQFHAIAADLLRRGPDGIWPQQPARIEAGALTLESIGLTVPLADLYATTRLARPLL